MDLLGKGAVPPIAKPAPSPKIKKDYCMSVVPNPDPIAYACNATFSKPIVEVNLDRAFEVKKVTCRRDNRCHRRLHKSRFSYFVYPLGLSGSTGLSARIVPQSKYAMRCKNHTPFSYKGQLRNNSTVPSL